MRACVWGSGPQLNEGVLSEMGLMNASGTYSYANLSV